MKIPCQKSSRSEQGYFLVATLIFAMVVGVSLGSYLLLSTQEERMVVRSERWNAALAMAEAGVDEALAQMNASPSDFAANGWGGGTLNYGPVTRTLVNGSYTVVISNDVNHTIYSTGSAAVPATAQEVSRTVRVTVTPEQVSPFSVGLGAVGNINMNGNSVATDSWDSQTNTLSSNGLYVPYLVSSNGDVASVQGIVNIGNHTINGNLYLGATATYTSSTNQVTGQIYYDYNIQFPDAQLPTTDTIFGTGNSISWQSPTVIRGTNVFGPAVGTNNYVPMNGYFIVSDSSPIYVPPGVTDVVQVATTTFSPSSITIGGGTTNSGTLIIFQDSGTATLGGNSSGGAIGNRPENFVYFGLPGVTSISLSGSSTFVGAIYAPSATMSLNGGGNANNLEGSAIVGSVTMNGHYLFHYDLALAQMLFGANRGFIPTSWQELY